MKLQVFAIKDRALNAFMQPFFMHTIGQAVRAFSDNMNDEKSSAHAHPDDYDLWHLGQFDDATGAFEQQDKPYQVGIGKNLITK